MVNLSCVQMNSDVNDEHAAHMQLASKNTSMVRA